MKARRWMAAGTMLLAALGLAVPSHASPYQIRVGWVVTPGHLAPLIVALAAKHPEIFRHLGKSYTMEAVHFQGTTPEIQAQAINDLDIASFSSAALALSITNAHLDERVVADVVADGHPGDFSEAYVVLADGPIKKVEDVKGKRVATNAIGSASDEAMRTMFQRHGIKDSDFTTVEASFANMPAMLEGGKVDLVGVLPQFADGIIGNPKYRVLFRAVDAVGPTQAVVWAMRAETIAKHRAALVDFFEDHIRARRWFLDPKNHAEALAITAAVTKLPVSRLQFAFTNEDFYRSPDAHPDLVSLQKEVDDSVKLGVLPKPISFIPQYVDLSLVEAARKRVDGK